MDKQTTQSHGLILLQEFHDAIGGSDRLIAVIGPNAIKSEYFRQNGRCSEHPTE